MSHDHFQGGNYEFTMDRAPIEETFVMKGFEEVEAGIVKWPMSVIRLCCEDREKLTDASEMVLQKWRSYTDESAFIFAETDGEPHNTITPIAHYKDGKYQLDLVLRNNITTSEHPLGVYHPHADLHHIKKENIGLIEVLGLAILPARLKTEMELLKNAILEGQDIRSMAEIEKHAQWVEEFMPAYRDTLNGNTADVSVTGGSESKEAVVEEILQKEIGKVFCRVLEDAGVFKRTPEGKEAFRRFVESLS